MLHDLPLVSPPPQNLAEKIFRFPALRVVLGTLLLTIPVTLVQTGIRPYTRRWTEQGFALAPAVAALLLALLVIFLYTVFIRLVEKRQATELALKASGQEIAAGTSIGMGLMAASVGVLWMAGSYHVLGTNSPSVVGVELAVSILSGVLEEILLRGLVFRITEEKFGTGISLGLSALLFGFLHITNPNATLWTSFAIALEAGLLLGAAYILTRRLWLAIGIHFGWNFAQGGIFGVAVSGAQFQGILKSERTGAEWLSGGAFGVEASVIGVVFCVAAFGIIMVMASRKGQILRPKWKRVQFVPTENAGIPAEMP